MSLRIEIACMIGFGAAYCDSFGGTGYGSWFYGAENAGYICIASSTVNRCSSQVF